MARSKTKNKLELTKAEQEIMQLIWAKGRVLIHDILADMPEPKPAYNTVSTFVRILEKKGFVNHKAYGKTYEYFPVVDREEYTSHYMNTVLKNFFNGSISQMMSFFSQKEQISVSEADEIIELMKSSKSQQ